MSTLRTTLLLLLALVFPTRASYSVLWGAVGFTAPGSWAEISRADADTISLIGFVLPRPRLDSTAPAANVVVDISIDHANPTLKQYAERKMSQVMSGPGTPKVVSDSFLSRDSSRVVSWSADLRGTSYDLRDHFVVHDSIQVDIRTAIPATYRGDSAWQSRFRAELDTLMHSTCVGGVHLFSATEIPCADIDHILPFSPEANADGARFVWFLNRWIGLNYKYVTAADFPTSPAFRQVPADSAKAGDVAWWPSLMALYSGETKSLAIAAGTRTLPSVVAQLGAVKFFRRVVPE